MAVKTELSADDEKGAGYGQLRISGLGQASGPIDFSLRRNQGNQPFLGNGRMWQATEAWHAAGDVIADGDTLVIPVGPEFVDPIVGQPTNVAYQLTIAAGTSKKVSSLNVRQPLFGSGAAAPDESAAIEQQRRDDEARRAAEDEKRRLREAEEEEARRHAAEQEAARRAVTDAEARQLSEQQDRPIAEPETQPSTSPAGTKKRWPMIAAIVALLVLVGGGAGAWFGCLIPGFRPAACKIDGSSPAPPDASESKSEASRDGELSCAGLSDGAACYRVAQKAIEQKKLEPARQLFQQAASLGSIEANLAVARMYDPETWSAEASPVEKPSWETAVFWYEKAARQGDVAAQVGGGKLLCKNAITDFEKSQGRTLLEQAANTGNAEAKALVADCK